MVVIFLVLYKRVRICVRNVSLCVGSEGRPHSPSPTCGAAGERGENKTKQTKNWGETWRKLLRVPPGITLLLKEERGSLWWGAEAGHGQPWGALGGRAGPEVPPGAWGGEAKGAGKRAGKPCWGGGQARGWCAGTAPSRLCHTSFINLQVLKYFGFFFPQKRSAVGVSNENIAFCIKKQKKSLTNQVLSASWICLKVHEGIQIP